MLSPVILVPAMLNGLMTGAVYALIALGLTLIYGVLHIINFAHGALLTAAMFAAFFAHQLLGLDPYLAAIGLTPLFFCARLRAAALRHRPGRARRGPQHPAGHARARRRHRERAALRAFAPTPAPSTCPTRFDVIELGSAFLAVPRVIAFGVVIVVALALWLDHAMDRHRQGDPRGRQGKARRRAVRHRRRAHLCGHVRPRHRLPCDRGLPAAPDLLRQSAAPATPSC